MPDNQNIPPHWEGIAALLVLQDQVKNLKSLKEFGFFTTNETHRLMHFTVSYLWQQWQLLDIKLLAQSEVGEVDPETQVNQWVKEIIKEQLKLPDPRKIQTINYADSEEDVEQKARMNKEVLRNWPEVVPKYVLWSPFIGTTDEINGGLILFRDKPFTEQELKMFGWLARNYQYTWQFLTKSRLIDFHNLLKKRRSKVILVSIIIIGLFFPIRLSVVSTATVEARDPALIDAPIPGIIKTFYVKPGDEVKAGQILVTLDKKDILNAIEISQKKVMFTQAKLRSATNQGYDKAETRSEIPVLEAELNVNKAELDYNQTMLKKTDIYSPIDGVAIFESKEDWVGQPVQAGENIMSIENPNDVHLKISLPVADLINLEVGDEGKFYVYGQFSEIPIKLTSLGYNAKMMPNKTLAYQFTAAFSDLKSHPRLGSQGTARLYGHYVPLIYYILRRPLQAARQTLGI